MIFLLSTLITESENNPVLAQLTEIKNGSQEAREGFIRQYDPFILNTTAKMTGRFVDKHNDDAYSIALFAFNKAIDTFDEGRGQSFFAFAKVLIRNDLIDHFRSEGRFRESTLTAGETSDPVFLEDRTPPVEMDEKFYLKNEIALFRTALEEYGISFGALVQESPKHEDSRRQMIRLAHRLHSNPEISREIRRTKKLPLKQLEPLVEVSRKTLEKHRRYLLAGFILLDSDLETMKDYFTQAL